MEESMTQTMASMTAAPPVVAREEYEARIAELRAREKAHSREGDAIAAARRRLPMVEVDARTPIVGARGTVTLLDAFEDRRILLAYYFMWHHGKPAAGQCEGCTFFTDQVRAPSLLHARGVTYATFCQGPYAESRRYRDFMGWEQPWYSVEGSLDALLGDGRRHNMMHLISYVRQGDRVFETWWTTRRGVEAMDNVYRLLDLTVFGRQEVWEDSPPGWPQTDWDRVFRRDGRPIAQWPRLAAGHSDALDEAGTR
jgi:predicted dithiol-disulfide oxidoreductase (DUF899 family)